MDNTQLIEKFYTAFSEGNAEVMADCYHKDIVFQDPAFGTLQGESVADMWRMLLSQKNTNINISFNNVQASADKGSVDWVAKYTYGKSKRDVTNRIHASFTFKDGKIIKHMDTFSLWKWTRQAMGTVGFLLGWTPYMKKKIQAITNEKLDSWVKRQTSS